MSTYAEIQDISLIAQASPIYATTNIHKFTVTWELPDQTINSTAAIRVYRYIGERGVCLDPNDIPPPPLNGSSSLSNLKLIYEIKQNFDTNDLPLSTYNIQYYNTDGTLGSLVNGLLDSDLRVLSYTDNLTNHYNTTSTTLMDLYGIINVNNDRQLLNEIYTTERTIYYMVATYVKGVADAAPYCIGTHYQTDIVDNFSTKTQVLHDVLHYEFDMIWQTKPLIRSGGTIGKGISRTAVDINQLYLDAAQRGPTGAGGAAWVSCRGSRGDVFKFNLSNGIQTGLGSNPQTSSWGHGVAVDVNSGDGISANRDGVIKHFKFNSPAFNLSTVSGPILSNRYIYGSTNIPGYSNFIALNARNPKPSNILIYNTQSKTIYKTIASLSPEAYGIASGPDSRIFSKASDDGSVHYTTIGPAWTPGTSMAGTGSDWQGTGITTDLYKKYPNTLGSKSDYYVLFTSAGGIRQKKAANVNSAGGWETISNTTLNDVRGVGIDGENNVWGLGAKRMKLYRMPSLSASPVYPIHGECRYPSTTLSGYPFTATNTREIEWFLTRDHNLMSGDALDAWMALVEFKRHEASHTYTPGGSEVINLGYDDNRGWKSNPANPNTMMYGIRMLNPTTAVNDIRAWNLQYGEANQTGRLLHPNFSNTDTVLIAASGGPQVTPSDSTIITYNGYKRIKCDNYNGFSYQYSDFTGNLLTAGIGETIYNYDLGHPEPSAPTLSLGVTGSNTLGYIEDHPECYPWPYYNDNSMPLIQPNDLVITFIDEADDSGDFERGGTPLQEFIDNGNRTTNPLATSHEVSGSWIGSAPLYYYPSYVGSGSYTSRDSTNYSNIWLEDVLAFRTTATELGYDTNNFLCMNVAWAYPTISPSVSAVQYITGYDTQTSTITTYDLGTAYGTVWAYRSPALTASAVSAISGSPVDVIMISRANVEVIIPEIGALTTPWLTGEFDSRFNITTSIEKKKVIIFIDVSGSMARDSIEGSYWINGLEKWHGAPPGTYGALEGTINWLETNGYVVEVYYCSNERWLRWLINAMIGNPYICTTGTAPPSRTFASAITSYDNLTTKFTLYINPGTFITRNWYLNTDDYGTVLNIESNNGTYLSNLNSYLTYVDMNYTYFNPSKGGREYLDNDVIHNDHFELPGWIGGSLNPKVKDLYTSGVSSGHFIPTAWITAQNIYQTDGQCSVFLSSAINDIMVSERWPEPRFFLDINDNPEFRQDYFHSPTYAPHLDIELYDKSVNFKRFSGKQDAVRKEVIVGVEPLPAVIQDRSIARTYPISSWNFTISTDNYWLQNDPIKQFNLTHDITGLNNQEDNQSNYIPLTSFTFQYGANVVSLTAQASGTSTISDRVFSQCVNVKEMNPLAYFDIISGQTIIDNNVTGISGYNAWFDGDPTMGYISGYAPFLNVVFVDKSYAHTFPISSYHWNFGDIYNEGPDDIYDPDSNYYTITASDVLSGGFSWDVPPKELPLWQTNISDITASHTYIMPGKYNVTLMVKASNTGTMDTYSKYVNTEGEEYRYEVHVEELMPTCGDIMVGYTSSTLTTAISTISGNGPLTAYFGITGFTEGSFPICQLRWQFGDHIETISKYPSAAQTSQGLDIINPTDIINSITPYVFNPLLPQSFNIGVSAVVCNTNTIVDCTPIDNNTGTIIPITNQKDSNYTLLKSRIDEYGNIIYLFGDNEHNVTHTVMLSGELGSI